MYDYWPRRDGAVVTHLTCNQKIGSSILPRGFILLDTRDFLLFFILSYEWFAPFTTVTMCAAVCAEMQLREAVCSTEQLLTVTVAVIDGNIFRLFIICLLLLLSRCD